MKRILAYTITRAATTPRARLLLNTLNRGVEQSGYRFDWYVWVNGSPLAEGICESAKRTGLIATYTAYPVNVGQHTPTNEALTLALEGDYDAVVRIDDDVDWQTKRWLAKLVEASTAFNDEYLLSPSVKGLKYPLDLSELTYTNGIPIKVNYTEALGGICRYHPTTLLRKHPYHADTRQPMGFGDATGIARWAQQHMIPMIVLQNVRVGHAKTTVGQEKEDSEHFRDHFLFQRCPFIPAWHPYDNRDADELCGEAATVQHVSP